jgi:hypothetical protein
MIWKPSFWWLATEIRVFVMMRNLLGDLWLVAAASGSGGDSTGGIQSPTLQDENPRSDLSWLCMAMALLKALFLWVMTFSRVSKVYVRATAALVHYFLLKGIAFGEASLLVLSWWRFTLLLQEIDHCSRTFLFAIFLFWLCASLDVSRLGPAWAEPGESSSQIWRARASSWRQTSQHRQLGSSQLLARSKSRLASQVLETFATCTENYRELFACIFNSISNEIEHPFSHD